MQAERIDLYRYFHLKRISGNGGYLDVYAPFEVSEIKPKLRPAMLVIAGGGYAFVSRRESAPVAFKYVANGYCAFVLDYSVNTAYPVPLVEACMAVAYIRENASKYRVDKNSVAATGFSVGGHLAAMLANICDEKEGIIVGLVKSARFLRKNSGKNNKQYQGDTKMKDIFIGAAYYPEMWDEGEVDKDIARCKELGINCLRVGEFAWGKMEPEEGKFDFSWLENVVNKLYENGIYTVMCTPTCTPPRWMLDKYPQMRRVTPDNQRQNVSSRCHVCKSSNVARGKNALIVEEMAKVFAGNKAIIGWQIDNELYPYQDGCFCENCKKGFGKYLKDKFGSPEKLNKTWGMTRWSLGYNSFDDVQPPYPDEWRHPSLRKAWWDYQCGLICSYVDEQAEILRKYGCKNIGTDMMTDNLLSYYAVNKKLDVVQYNHYDTADRLYTNAFAYDFLRCVKDKPFWVTETQVGWNGSEYAENGYRPEGNCYVNTWLPFAKGAEMNMYWLFRTHPNGHELGHGALYSSAGRSYSVTEEVKRAVAHLKKCEKFLGCTKIESKIALHYSATSAINLKVAPLVKNFDYRQTIIDKYHRALRHYNVDVIDTPHGLEGYEVIISPFLSTADENDFKARIIDWINKGGTWIVGPMTDIMDCNVSKYTDAPYGFLEELSGVYTKYQKPIDNDLFKAKWNDGEACTVGGCFDAYECKEGTNSLANYSECEFAPLSVITERTVGKGKVILTGSVVSEKDLLKLVNKKPIAEASKNIALVERSGEGCGIIAAEIENKDGFIILDGEYTDLISGKRFCGRVDIMPYEVFVFFKQS